MSFLTFSCSLFVIGTYDDLLSAREEFHRRVARDETRVHQVWLLSFPNSPFLIQTAFLRSLFVT